MIALVKHKVYGKTLSMMGSEWKYHITCYDIDWAEAQDWCVQYIGEFDKEWYKLGIDPAESMLEGRTRTVWYFKEERHAVLFTLRWS